MSELFAQYRTHIKLGFRVEIYSYPNQNSTSRGRPGCMTARNPLRSLSWHAFKDHLDWGCRDGGPLISFFTNWHRAMHWRQWHINRGAKDVALMAVWLDGLQVYDAYEIASALGVRRGHISQHQDEYLLYGGINEDDYRILAVFSGILDPEPVGLSLPGCKFEAKIPGGFSRPSLGLQEITGSRRLKDATEDIMLEVYSCTGIINSFQIASLLLSVGGVPYTSRPCANGRKYDYIIRLGF